MKQGELTRVIVDVRDVYKSFGTLEILRGVSLQVREKEDVYKRQVRSQTLSLKSQEFVNLSRISAAPVFRIIREDIAANMFSYVFMVYILQFNGTILSSVGLEFLGLGPTRGISLGLVMQNAVNWNALHLGMWWWTIIPGLILTLLIVSLYFINTGLDEVFNPRLREL